jgi:hypothetical protein
MGKGGSKLSRRSADSRRGKLGKICLALTNPYAG